MTVPRLGIGALFALALSASHMVFAAPAATGPRLLPPPVQPSDDAASAAGPLVPNAGARMPRASTVNADADVQFMGIGYADTKALRHGLTPPDMGGASSGQFILQIVNGGAAIYTTAGALVSPVTSDVAFWKAAGMLTLTSNGLSDPRVVYDAASGRFFACELTLGGPSKTNPTRHNYIFLAVSKTSNPGDGFVALTIPIKAGVFGDFPTLGVNADAVTLSTNNFGPDGKFVDLSVFTLPKADLVGGSPKTARLQRFDSVSSDTYGSTLRAVDSQNASSGTQTIIALGKLHEVKAASLTSVGQPGAALSASTTLYANIDGNPAPARQPVGKYDAGDNRIGANVSQVGDFVYFTNEVSDDQGSGGAHSDYIHWGIVRVSTNTLVAEGRIIDNVRAIDYTYPAIDANSSGRFVIAYDGSSVTGPISAYATVCDFDQVALSVSCGAPKTIAVGLDRAFYLYTSNRWGDYSAIQTDPANPNAFWLYQEIPGARISTGSAWATVITHLLTQ